MAKDLEGKWRGGCRNHPSNRFGACGLFQREAGSSKCGSCGCVARCHVLLEKCQEHIYCPGYDELTISVGECLNCGCSPNKHTFKPGTLQEEKPAETKESPDSNLWDNIRKLAGEQRKQQQQQNPPLRKNPRQHGGARKMAGRKKSIPKELLVTPVKIKNHKLGHYIPNGKKEFIPFQETEFTISSVEDTLCKHFLGIGRDMADSSFKFHIMRTLKGPPLSSNSHLSGSSFYFWWESLLSTEDVDSLDWISDTDVDDLDLKGLCGEKSSSKQCSSSKVVSTHSFSSPLSSEQRSTGNVSATQSLPPPSGQRSVAGNVSDSTQSVSPPSGQRSVARNVFTLKCSSRQSSGQSSTGTASSSASTRGQLSVRAKHLDHMRFIRTATSRIPKQPLPTPSKILLLGKSVALPRPCHEGIPIEVYQYQVSDDWCAIQVQGPEHAVVEISGFPDRPFANGSFQVAFTTRTITPCEFLSGDSSYIFKQHHIDEYGLQQHEDASMISEEFLHELQAANEKKTAKEVQVAAVCCSLCYHFTQECKAKIQDFGKEIYVVPSVHVKLLSGQFPPWGLIEPRIRGRWHKFLNNDGQLVAMEDNPAEEVVEFCNKSLAFAHWTYKHFEGRAVVCDLQGSDFQLTDLEIASSDSSLFGIGNLSHYALEMFKKYHCCNVYCAALELEALNTTNSDGQLDQILASPEVLSLPSDDEDLLSLHALLEVENKSRKADAKESQLATMDSPSFSLETELICQICLLNKIDCVFYNCGHMYCCNSCASKLSESSNCCPVCRKAVEEIVKVYL